MQMNKFLSVLLVSAVFSYILVGHNACASDASASDSKSVPAFASASSTSAPVEPRSKYDRHPNFNPYVGVAYQYRSTTSREDWRNLFPQSFHQGALFFGNKFNQYCGLEFSHFHYLERSVHSDDKSSFFGTSTSGQLMYVASIKRKGFTLDLDLYHLLDPDFSVLGIFGVGLDKSNILIRSASGANDLSSAFEGVKGRKSLYGRLGIGFDYIKRHLGFNFRGVWELTSAVRLDVDSMLSKFPNTTNDAYKNTYLISVGVFYSF